MRYSEEDRKSLECIEYMMPIVADADMGFGTLTGCMKLTRSFVESGVAMIHMDDLALGLKKFTNGEGRTIVPTSEYLSRMWMSHWFLRNQVPKLRKNHMNIGSDLIA